MKILETQAPEESSINMTPLIDMVFLLLIFFLVATTFAQEEIERGLQLPGSDSPQPLSAPPKYLIINITNEGILKVGGRAYSYREIARTLADVAKNQPDRDVLIRADKDSRHEYFARVVELAHKAGISKTKIGYVLRADMVSPGE
jgi:biopolymer transport protein ExbD